MEALKLAAKILFGASGPKLDLAGSTDSGIVQGMLDHFSSDIPHETFYQTYLGYLSTTLHAFPGKVLPGVDALLDALQYEGVTLSLLTGNIQDAAWKKLHHYGLSDYFKVGAFGDDHHDRNKLGPIVLDRTREFYAFDFQPQDVIVVGDTPKDIACGKALGATTLAVTTGGFSIAELVAYGADYAFDDLASPGVFDVLR